MRKPQRSQLFIALLVLSLFVTTRPELAQANFLAACKKIFMGQKDQPRPDLSLMSQAQIIQLLKEKQIPAFMKKTRNGEIPVLMLNPATYPKLQELLQGTYGTEVHLQPEWRNDHGSLRVGEYMIDVDTPGARGFGEINANGIAWKRIDSYLAHSRKNIVETAFLLSPQERLSIEFYHRVRRASVFRVPFTFGGARNQEHPDMLRSGENCFSFSKATSVSSHRSEIASRLNQLGIKNIEQLLKSADVQSYLVQIREVVMSANPDSAKDMNVKTIVKSGDMALIEKALKEQNIAADSAQVAQWLISYTATVEYEVTLRTLGVTSGVGFEDMQSPRASFVIIFERMDRAQDFSSGRYTAKGYFNSWGIDGQRELDK